MLPAKVRDAVRGLLRKRVARLVRALNLPADPLADGLLAEDARLVGEAGWMLDPEAAATSLIMRHEDNARRYARVCVWDGECEADATTDDGLCAAHAGQQAQMDEDESAGLDEHVARIVAENEAG